MIGIRAEEMLRSFLAAVVLLLLVACASGNGPALEDPTRNSSLYQHLDAAELASGYTGVSEINYTLELTLDNVETIALWLRDAWIDRPKKNPRYGLMYSLSLQQLANFHRERDREGVYRELMETSTLAFYSSQLIALEDLARCSDSTGGLVYRTNWSDERAEVISTYYASRSPADREQILSVLMNFAGNRDLGDPDRGACGSGIKAMRKAMEAGACRPAEEWQTVHRPENSQVCEGEEFVRIGKVSRVFRTTGTRHSDK